MKQSLILMFLSFFLLILFVQCSDRIIDKPEMVRVEGGVFMMGCTNEQSNCEEDEKPVHKVIIEDFYIGKYEVTVDQYQLFCTDTKRSMPEAPKWGWQKNILL